MHGEIFWIILEISGSMHCGDCLCFQYVTCGNWQLGCPSNDCFDKYYPESLAQGASFNRCNGENLKLMFMEETMVMQLLQL